MALTAASEVTPAASMPGRSRNFRRLMVGSTVSMLGSRLTATGYPLLVLALTGSPLVAGLTAFAATAPSILVYLPAGAWVDRWDPRRAMLYSELGRGAAIGVVVVVVVLGRPSVVLLIAVAVVEESLEVFSVLAERRFVSLLLETHTAEPRDSAPALAGAEARTHTVVLLGRPLGGLLFGWARTLPFLADLVSFGISVTVLIGLGKRQSAPRLVSLGHRHLRSEIRAGFSWLKRDRFARLALPLTTCTTLVGQALIMIFLAEAHARSLPPVQIGLVLAASGVGGALGCTVAGRLFRSWGYSLLKIQVWVWALALALLASSGGGSFVVISLVMTTTGFTGALGNVALDTYLVCNVDGKMLARVTSIDRLTSFGALALGPLIGGFLAGRYGIQQSLWGLFAFFVATALVTELVRRTAKAMGRWAGPPLAGPSGSLAHRKRTWPLVAGRASQWSTRSRSGDWATPELRPAECAMPRYEGEAAARSSQAPV